MNVEREMNRWLKEHFPEVLEKWEKHLKEFSRKYYEERFAAIKKWFDSGAEIPEEIRKAVSYVLKMQEENPEKGYEHRRIIMQICRKLEGWPYTR